MATVYAATGFGGRQGLDVLEQSPADFEVFCDYLERVVDIRKNLADYEAAKTAQMTWGNGKT